MNRCVICGHGLRELISIEPDPENEPYYMVFICYECIDKANGAKEEWEKYKLEGMKK